VINRLNRGSGEGEGEGDDTATGARMLGAPWTVPSSGKTHERTVGTVRVERLPVALLRGDSHQALDLLFAKLGEAHPRQTWASRLACGNHASDDLDELLTSLLCNTADEEQLLPDS